MEGKKRNRLGEKMSTTKSVFLQTYGNRIDLSIRSLEIHKMKGGYGGDLNLQEIVNILKTSKMEIERLQRVNDDLVKVLDQKETQLKEKETQLNKVGANISNG